MQFTAGKRPKHDMLTLLRKAGESVIIGDEITVTILRVFGNQVRIGISAPKNISVHREEVYDRIKREQAQDEPGSKELASE